MVFAIRITKFLHRGNNLTGGKSNDIATSWEKF